MDFNIQPHTAMQLQERESVCVCVYACMWAYACECVRVCAKTRIHQNSCTAYVGVHTCINEFVYICITEYAHTHVCVSVSMRQQRRATCVDSRLCISLCSAHAHTLSLSSHPSNPPSLPPCTSAQYPRSPPPPPLLPLLPLWSFASALLAVFPSHPRETNLQHTATCCNMLQHAATHCNTL